LQPESDRIAPSFLFEHLAPVAPPRPVEQFSEQVSEMEAPENYWLDDAGIEIIRATRSWIQYGTVGFAVICIVIGAVEALFGR
jgi:hypothetical protein